MPFPDLWAVIYDGDAPLDVRAAAPIIAERCGCPAVDAAAALRRSAGILARRLPGAMALQAVSRLADAGVPALAWPEGRLVGLPYPLTVERLDFDHPHVLIAETQDGALYEVQWSDLRAVACGLLKRRVGLRTKRALWPLAEKVIRSLDPRSRDHDGTGASPLMRSLGGATAKVPVVETCLLMSLAILGRGALHLRVEGEHFNYNALGSNRTLSSAENFRALVRTIIDRAPHALTNFSRELVIGSRRVSWPELSHLGGLDLCAEWLLQRAVARSSPE